MEENKTITNDKEESSVPNQEVKKKRKYLFLEKFNDYKEEIDYRLCNLWMMNYLHAAATVFLGIVVLYYVVCN